MRVRGFLRRSRHFLGLQRTFRLGSDAAEDKVVSPSPTTGGKKLEQLGGARPPHFLAPAVPCKRAQWHQSRGGWCWPPASPVFRSGKCSGGSREVLGTGGRKVLSTGGEGPSGSRGSKDLQGEGTLLEDFPSWQRWLAMP